jgi:hypothetical protein
MSDFENNFGSSSSSRSSPSPAASNSHDYTYFEHEGEPPFVTLFNKSRFTEGSWFSYLLLVLWFPFGIIWASVRLVLTFAIGMPLLTVFNIFDGERLFWLLVGNFFGFHSKLTNPEALATPEQAPIIVLNHITDFDGIAFFGVVPCKNIIVIGMKLWYHLFFIFFYFIFFFFCYIYSWCFFEPPYKVGEISWLESKNHPSADRPIEEGYNKK